MKMTEAQIKMLEGGFLGPRPGSNSFPLLQLGKGELRIDGEQLDTMNRSGWLNAVPSSTHSTIEGGDAGPYGEVPDVELLFHYQLTPAGRAALAEETGGGE